MPRSRFTTGLLAALVAAMLPLVPASAATVTAQAKASVVKPLVLTALQNLDLGMLVLGPGTWSGASVTLSQAGQLTCPANITCSGAAQAAQFTVAGSNNTTVTITVPDVTLVNQADSAQTLTLRVDAPSTIALPNSGQKGVDFGVGGSITLDSTTAAGDYAGTITVTADYQ